MPGRQTERRRSRVAVRSVPHRQHEVPEREMRRAVAASYLQHVSRSSNEEFVTRLGRTETSEDEKRMIVLILLLFFSIFYDVLVSLLHLEL